jgi:riboflavin synthase
MFTGIVTAVGTVRKVARRRRGGGEGLEITIAAPYTDLSVGESIAVDGACLTVTRLGRGTFSVAAVTTTRGRTNFGEYRAGRRTNLERALALGERLGGHLVSGHVDGVGEVVGRKAKGDALLLDIRAPRSVLEATVPRGSIAVDGVSMTVNDLKDGGVVQVSVIPFTRRSTTLGRAKVGSRVHLEADQVGRFVMRALAPYLAKRRPGRGG